MSKIGKAIFVSGGMIFDFTLTIGGTSYHFDNKSVSSTVANAYKFDRVKQGNVDKWDLYVYTSATITFSKLKHLVDYCIVGGGGGGGGGCCWGSSWTQNGTSGGYGGGGGYAEQKKKMLSLNTAQTITLGGGGGGGAAGAGSVGNPGADGGVGNGSSFGSLLSAVGGGYGSKAYSGGNGVTVTTGGYANTARKYCFDDNSMVEVCGQNTGLRGSGGNRGTYYTTQSDPYATSGGWGSTGLFVIRSTPKE